MRYQITTTYTILLSTAEAMYHICPVCNAPKLNRCVLPNGRYYNDAIVHAERRAMVTITHPGRYVQWQFGIGLV